MALNKLPLDTWVVVDVALDEGNVISAHGSQHDAEAECDKRNEGLAVQVPAEARRGKRWRDCCSLMRRCASPISARRWVLTGIRNM